MLRPDDQAVLDRLTQLGDRLERPREFRAYLYLRGEDARPAEITLSAVRREAQALGYAVSEAAKPGLVLSRRTAVDPATLGRLIADLIALSDRTATEFDGWECALRRPSLFGQLLRGR